jgi:hypothetical protein
MARTTRRELRELRLKRAGRARTKRRIVAVTTAGLMLVGSIALASGQQQRELTLDSIQTTQYSDVLIFGGEYICRQSNVEGGQPVYDAACDEGQRTIKVMYDAPPKKAAEDSVIGSVTGTSWTADWKVDATPAVYDNIGGEKKAQAVIDQPDGASSDRVTFTITKEDTVTAYTGPTSGDEGATVTLDATVEDHDLSFFPNDPNLKGSVSFQLYQNDETMTVGSAVVGTLTNGALATPKPQLVLPSVGTYKMKVSFTAANGGEDFYNNSQSGFVTITVNAVSGDTGRAAPAVANDYIDNTLTSQNRNTCRTTLGNNWRGEIISYVAQTYNPKPFVDTEVFADIRRLCEL